MYRKLSSKVAVMATALALNYSVIGPIMADTNKVGIQHLDLPGYRMPYVDAGIGEPVVFVHGAISDLRTWESYLEPVSRNHRYISYTRRHYGTQEWSVANPSYNHDQHADDLIALIESLNVGPVHLVTWSSGGVSSTITAANRPELVKSIVHFEPVLNGVMNGVPGSDKLGAEWGARWAPVSEAAKKGSDVEAAERMVEVVFELPRGGFDSMPDVNQNIVLDNARTIALFMFSNNTKTNPDCDYLKKISTPTTVVLGADTNEWWSLMSKTVQQCMPNATIETIADVNHAGPIFAVDKIITLIDRQIAAVK